ncbi:MAG: hypothetical protein H0U67_15100 [Gemmatimonadetes bacterium]|nr:hypothetical protein [Gemmatimonadota bacterium]MBA4158344.1 hypothetical protein [Gemmatimonadota bacterium]
MTRRHFIWLALTSFCALVISYWVVFLSSGWRGHAKDLYWSRHAYLSPEGRIQRQFHYLQLDAAGVSNYVRDYEKYRGPLSKFRHPDDDFFNVYLLSTDFFRNGASETLPVRYVLFYDPYISPCWNPCVPMS